MYIYIFIHLATMKGFRNLRFNYMPNTIGCIDGCHIRIHAPRDKRSDYTNRKMFQSIVLLVNISKILLHFFFILNTIILFLILRLYVMLSWNLPIFSLVGQEVPMTRGSSKIHLWDKH